MSLFSKNNYNISSLLIGPLPHKKEGISLAFDLVRKEFEKDRLPHRVIDISYSISNKPIGSMKNQF